MEKVTRYKCSFCQKLAVNPETIEKHEKVCIKNPEGKNCYMCEMAYHDDYDPGDEYSGIVKDQCMCIYTEDVVSTVIGPADGNVAPNCCMFHRTDDGYWYRELKDAEKNLEKY